MLVRGSLLLGCNGRSMGQGGMGVGSLLEKQAGIGSNVRPEFVSVWPQPKYLAAPGPLTWPL